MGRRVERSRIPYDPTFASRWGGDHARDPKSFMGILEIERVSLNKDGYTQQGRYFGIGAPIYRVIGGDPTQHVEFYIRAMDRAMAKNFVRAGYPNAVIAH